MWYDADIDAKMRRTAKPPDAGRPHQGREALAFGLVLSLLSVVMLMGMASTGWRPACWPSPSSSTPSSTPCG
jgi:protoheme IX farnesyltransferase